MNAILQINGLGPERPCPVWSTLSSLRPVWFTPTLDPGPVQPRLVILQCAVQRHHLAALGYAQLACPIVASCGDAAPLTNLDQVFRNLPLLTRLHVEGFDYFALYQRWRQEQGQPDLSARLVFQKLCADTLFPPRAQPKVRDWIFAGQVYPAHEERLLHVRNTLIPQLLAAAPDGLVVGSGWTALVPAARPALPQADLNELYASSRVVVAIDAHDGAGYTSTRTLEALHGGHCTLVYAHAGWHAWSELRHGEHLLLFRDARQFRDLLGQVRRDPAWAAGIGRAGRERVLEKGWTYSGWLRSALTLVEEAS